MTTLPGRLNTTLLVVDVQIDVMASSLGSEAIIANIVRLVNKARAQDVRIVWVQHSSDQLPRGSAGWEYVPELVRHASEPLVHKTYGDAFEDTELESILAEAAVGRLIVAGAQTDQCIRSTLHGALARGYDTILVSDAHTTEDLTEWGAPPPAEVVSHTNLYWSFQTAPGREAGTIDTESVVF